MTNKVKKLKAFRVEFSTPGSSGFSEFLLVSDESELETALEAKTKCFNIGNPHCKITHKAEIPLSQLKIADLSLTEFLLLKTI